MVLIITGVCELILLIAFTFYAMASSSNNKKDKANFKIELDELELINAATNELQKLRRIK